VTPQVVRAGFQSVVPFLSIRGAARLAEFLSAAFNGEETYRSKTHFEVRIGDSMVMLGEAGDRPPTTGQLFMYVDDADALYQRAIQAGGTSLMEPCERPWGEGEEMLRAAGVKDPNGNSWFLAGPKQPD
jgi:PhnB protein